MSKVFKNKNVLLVAGLLVGLVTLFSHSLRVEIKPAKAATEQKAETEQAVVITPSDAVTVNAFNFAVDGFLEIAPVFQQVEETFKAIPVYCGKATSLFQTLFRYTISPNAP
jgi:hypothetical protein